jgi:hypothetical protein
MAKPSAPYLIIERRKIEIVSHRAHRVAKRTLVSSRIAQFPYLFHAIIAP